MPLAAYRNNALGVLLLSLQLGVSSFGGPIAHLGYFERACVQRRQWLSSEQFASVVALCQLLPGPLSSQVWFLIGLHRAGWLGAVAAAIGFTLPSALLMYAFAVFAPQFPAIDAILHGLKLVAVAVVAQAVWNMANKLCPDRRRAGIALAAAALLLVMGGASMQFVVLAFGAAAGFFLCRGVHASVTALPSGGGRIAGSLSFVVFCLLLIALPLLSFNSPRSLAAFGTIFYRTGALVFGGGHVILPLLRDALVPSGWVSDGVFLTGYGAAQALPGPLFTMAAYMGAVSSPHDQALWATVAVLFLFLPGMLLAISGLSLWSWIAPAPRAQAALAGINAAMVGVLGAAFYDPVWTSAIRSGTDVAIALTGFLLLERWRTPPILIVVLCEGLNLAFK